MGKRKSITFQWSIEKGLEKASKIPFKRNLTLILISDAMAHSVNGMAEKINLSRRGDRIYLEVNIITCDTYNPKANVDLERYNKTISRDADSTIIQQDYPGGTKSTVQTPFDEYFSGTSIVDYLVRFLKAWDYLIDEVKIHHSQT